jgi:hypothetical protein
MKPDLIVFGPGVLQNNWGGYFAVFMIVSNFRSGNPLIIKKHDGTRPFRNPGGYHVLILEVWL